MSKYTTELRYICEVEAGLSESVGYNGIDSVLTSAAPKVFSFSFPIFDESYRLTLEKKILRHFYTREISEETYGLWKLRLEDKMNLIMPYYNKMYESELLEFNPMYDVDYTKEGENEGSGDKTDVSSNTRTLNTEKSTTGTVEVEGEEGGNTIRTLDTEKDTTMSGTDGNTRTLNTVEATEADNNKTNTRTLNTTRAEDTEDTSGNTRWDLYSDTPQGGINGITADNDSVANNTYLTDARKITDSGSGTKDSEIRETGTITDSEDTDVDESKATTGTITDAGTKSGTESVEETGTITDARNLTNEQTTTHNMSEAETGTIGDSGRLTSSVSNMNEYTERVFGKMSGNSYSYLLMEFRKTFLRIDEMICKELEPLFFGLW